MVAHMATDKVRVSGYVDTALAGLIDDTAAALGQTRSSLVAEVLQNAGPVMEVLRDLGLALQEAPERHRLALEQFAAAMRPMTEEARIGLEGLERLATDPPPSNRGVRK
jgi:hypothetical protein